MTIVMHQQVLATYSGLEVIEKILLYLLVLISCLQCFDAVGWAEGRASSL